MVQGFFRPTIFDNADKLLGRRKLIGRSTDTYDDKPNDPMSLAQLQVYKYSSVNVPSGVADSTSTPAPGGVPATPSKPLNLDRLAHLAEVADSTPRSSPAGSPAPEDTATPAPGAGDATPAVAGAAIEGAQPETEGVLPLMPLDQAIVACITEGAKGDEKKTRDFFGGIMVIGGGSKTYNFNVYLEQRLRALQPNFQKEILVGPPPRELDPQVLVWKGGSVFGKMRGTNDSWIGQLEFDRLGVRILNQKCMWAY